MFSWFKQRAAKPVKCVTEAQVLAIIAKRERAREAALAPPDEIWVRYLANGDTLTTAWEPDNYSGVPVSDGVLSFYKYTRVKA